MNNFPCPACKKPLWWNGTRTSSDNEGKRWYQCAGHRIYCKYCGVRLWKLRDDKRHLASSMLYASVYPFIVRPIYKEYGPIIALPLMVISLVMLEIILTRYRYEKWDDHKNDVAEETEEDAQFRCFQCDMMIPSDADVCPQCGWTWK